MIPLFGNNYRRQYPKQNNSFSRESLSNLAGLTRSTFFLMLMFSSVFHQLLVQMMFSPLQDSSLERWIQTGWCCENIMKSGLYAFTLAVWQIHLQVQLWTLCIAVWKLVLLSSQEKTRYNNLRTEGEALSSFCQAGDFIQAAGLLLSLTTSQISTLVPKTNPVPLKWLVLCCVDYQT